MTGTWPPPPTDRAPWHDRRLRIRGDGPPQHFTVREVRLWGQQVLIDEDAAVYCPDCWRFIHVLKLAAPDNHHRIGLRPRSGAIFQYDGDDEPPRRERSVRELEF